MEQIKFIEEEINKAFNKLNDGDRSDLLTGKLFHHLSFDKTSLEDRKILRHHLHKSIHNFEEKLEQSKKDEKLTSIYLRQIMLRDCMLEKIPKTTTASMQNFEEYLKNV